MENELTCPICLELFQRPVVLPCSHNLCTNCAKSILEPHGSPKEWAKWVTENKETSFKSHLEPKVKCPACRQKIHVDPRGVEALPRNKILENVIEKFKEERRVPGSTPKEPYPCQFCENYLPNEATLMCEQCGFMYCGSCFDLCHPKRGPLAEHTVGPPTMKPFKAKEDNTMCHMHPNEKPVLHCFSCKSAICYLCKESGEHKTHHAELLELVFRKTKEELEQALTSVVKKNTTAQKLLISLEGMRSVTKQSGCSVEEHVKKECDALITIVNKKKAELLSHVDGKYNEIVSELHDAIIRSEETLHSSEGLVEYSREAMKETNAITFLQTSSALKTRLDLMLGALKNLPSSSSINPSLDHLAMDTSWERKVLKKLTWLRIPGSPTFDQSKCSVMNRTIRLVWSPPQSAVDSYHLEVQIISPEKGPDGLPKKELTKISTGSICKHTLECSEYNCVLVARVKASNKAGEGPFCEEIVLRTQKGLHFKLDPCSSHQRELVFSRDCRIAKLTHPVRASVLGDIPLTTGKHYWKIKVDQFTGEQHAGYIAVGVSQKKAKDEIIGDDTNSFALQIFENVSMWTENTSNRIQVKIKAKVIKDSNIAVLLDQERHFMYVYLNGKLQTDESRPGGPSFIGIVGTFYPALSLYGTNVQLSVQSGLHLPTAPPDESLRSVVCLAPERPSGCTDGEVDFLTAIIDSTESNDLLKQKFNSECQATARAQASIYFKENFKEKLAIKTESPLINQEDCSVENTKLTLAWIPPAKCDIDSYILEVDVLARDTNIHQERNFVKAYQGPKCKFTVRELAYNVTVVARVIAMNTAGLSKPSNEVSLATEKGVIFKLNQATLHSTLKLSHGNTIVKQMKLAHANAFGDANLADGCHFWEVEIINFKGNNLFLAIGVSKKPSQDSILGNDNNSHALQVLSEANNRLEKNNSKLQILKKAKDLRNSIFGLLLNLNEKCLNIYLDGELQTDRVERPKGPTFNNVVGTFYAGMCLYGSKTQLRLVTGVETPSPPDSPIINKLRCSVENTTVRVAWQPPSTKCCVNYYVLEIETVKATEFTSRKRKEKGFRRVYEGPAKEHTMYSVPYNVKMVVRVTAVNSAGEGTPSDEHVISTPKGLYFHLDPSTANTDLLSIDNNNCTVSLKSPIYGFILGNVKISTGCHYWRIHVDQFSSPNMLSIIGVGVACGMIEDPILGEDTDSYAVQINEHPKTSCTNTKNRIQITRDSDAMIHSNIGVLFNLDERFLNLYLNGGSRGSYNLIAEEKLNLALGKLLTDTCRPSGPSFSGITGEYYPALSLYGTNVKLTIHTGEQFDA